jgi:hypothetical protein
MAQPATNFFVGVNARDKLTISKTTFQDFYRRVQIHEMTHLVSNFSLNASSDISASIIDYLLSPNGANNGLAAVPAFWARYKADAAGLAAACSTTPRGADCSTNDAYQAKRGPIFEAAFEAIFKEKVGTPMKLRKGTHNLQDTIATRLSSFL